MKLQAVILLFAKALERIVVTVAGSLSVPPIEFPLNALAPMVTSCIPLLKATLVRPLSSKAEAQISVMGSPL